MSISGETKQEQVRKKRIENIRRYKTRASEKEEDRVYQETKQEQVRKKRIEYIRRQNKSK